MSAGGPQRSFQEWQHVLDDADGRGMILVHEFDQPQGGWGIRRVEIAHGPMPMLGTTVYIRQRADALLIYTSDVLDAATVTLPHMRGERLAKHLIRKWDLWRKVTWTKPRLPR